MPLDSTPFVVAAAIILTFAVGLLISERNRANRERRKLDKRIVKLKAKAKRTDARLRELEQRHR